MNRQNAREVSKQKAKEVHGRFQQILMEQTQIKQDITTYFEKKTRTATFDALQKIKRCSLIHYNDDTYLFAKNVVTFKVTHQCRTEFLQKLTVVCDHQIALYENLVLEMSAVEMGVFSLPGQNKINKSIDLCKLNYTKTHEKVHAQLSQLDKKIKVASKVFFDHCNRCHSTYKLNVDTFGHFDKSHFAKTYTHRVCVRVPKKHDIKKRYLAFASQRHARHSREEVLECIKMSQILKELCN
jgi:hypothetical protein